MLKTQESTTFESIAEIDPIVSSTNWIKPLTSKQYFKFSMVQSIHCHALKNKNANHSMKKVQNLGNERRQMYKKPRQESSLCDISYARYSEKRFIQIFEALYGDAMLVSHWGAQF